MPAPVQVGDVLAGKYEVEAILGRGGVGVVVKARHLALLEPCAIKVMLPDVAAVPLSRERFLREARACAKLRSDHVVRVFDVGELDEETPYMVLEYLEGVDLEKHVGEHPLPLAEAALYVLQICAALAEAHALGIVHRDIKPANVFLARLPDDSRRIKLLDFGISKVLTGAVDQVHTLDGTVMGTPYFMAPEQVRGDAVDPRTDIWALGVLFYFLLTARHPFAGGAPARTFALVLRAAPEPPSHVTEGLPPAIDEIVLRCLQKDPELRPASVREIVDAVAPWAADASAPISLRVRRIFESSADGRASCQGFATPRAVAPTLGDPSPAGVPMTVAAPAAEQAKPRPPAERARRRPMSHKAAVACVGVAALAGAVASRVAASPDRTEGADAPSPATWEGGGRQREARRSPPAPSTSSAATSAPEVDRPPSPAASADAAPAKRQGRVSTAHAPIVPRSAGFDLGSRH